MMAGSAALLVAVGPAKAIEQVDRAATTPVDLKIADDVRNGEGRFSGIDYATSDRFRRAWLVLHYRFQAPCRDSEGECEMDAPVQVSVPGLTYDPAAKRVVYERAGAEPVVCASVRRGGFPGFRSSLAATGNCDYRLVKVDRLVDDGFAGRKDRREEVHFAVQGR
ncbi:hypothetical protein AMOR_37410 [Anaeromyxobacter oryzae]|uniref:Lipoprotein n=2 Tax=Anaeromyxobacter oryzae TaxID=2918170 RepID=A0ABM7WZ34_9BACT|nr:hypothetical protein AMOR_37410 [Anaeromyxobacter oryzae]